MTRARIAIPQKKKYFGNNGLNQVYYFLGSSQIEMIVAPRPLFFAKKAWLAFFCHCPDQSCAQKIKRAN